MTVSTERMADRSILAGRSIFLSASIPDPARWDGEFDALEITDAVVAAAKSVLTLGAVLVTAAHPTIAPLLLYVASELPRTASPGVIVYQSRLFDNVLPDATRRFENEGIGVMRWVDMVDGDEPVPGRWDDSLLAMRLAMLRETDPVAAILIGGMTGIRDEYELFAEMFEGRPAYALGRPGGEARSIPTNTTTAFDPELRSGDVYPALFRRVAADIQARLGGR